MALNEIRHFPTSDPKFIEYHFTDGLTIIDKGACAACGQNKTVVTSIFDNQDGITEGTMYIGTTLCADCIVNAQGYVEDGPTEMDACVNCGHERDHHTPGCERLAMGPGHAQVSVLCPCRGFGT